MQTPVSPCPCPAHTAPLPRAIQTTLYDLIAALHTEVQFDEDDVVTAVVIHLLETYRVTFTDDQEHRRLVWDRGERAAQAAERTVELSFA
jgi:hypothetical protein